MKKLMDGEHDIESIDVAGKLAYVMAAQANNEDMNALSADKYIEWLDGFDFTDFSDALSDVMEIFMGSSQGSVSPK